MLFRGHAPVWCALAVVVALEVLRVGHGHAAMFVGALVAPVVSARAAVVHRALGSWGPRLANAALLVVALRVALGPAWRQVDHWSIPYATAASVVVASLAWALTPWLGSWWKWIAGASAAWAVLLCIPHWAGVALEPPVLQLPEYVDRDADLGSAPAWDPRGHLRRSRRHEERGQLNQALGHALAAAELEDDLLVPATGRVPRQDNIARWHVARLASARGYHGVSFLAYARSTRSSWCGNGARQLHAEREAALLREFWLSLALRAPDSRAAARASMTGQ